MMSAINAQLPDGIIYLGSEALNQVLSCDFFFCNSNDDTYITTAALRRSGNQPPDRQSLPKPDAGAGNALSVSIQAAAPMHKWQRGEEPPHSDLHDGKVLIIDSAVVLQPGMPRADVNDLKVTVVSGNDMRCCRICAVAERNTSPLEQYDVEACEAEVQTALENLHRKVEAVRELHDDVKA